MHPERWEPYARFLEKNGVSKESISLAKDQLSSIVEALQAPVFSLSSVADLDDSDAMRAISQITGLEVSGLVKVSFKELASKVQIMPSELRHKEIKNQLTDELGRRFRAWIENPQKGMGAMFYKLTDPNKRCPVDIHDGAVQHLVLYRATTEQLERTFGRKLGNEFERSLWALLRFYTAFILANHEQGRDLAALGLDLCTQVYPVGLLKDRPSVWRILVA